jgi:hypothetical protein
MQDNHQHQQRLADLAFRRAKHGVQVAQQEGDAEPEADTDEDPVEDADA